MITWFKGLSTLWKVVAIVVVLIVAVLIFDAFTGYVSDFKGWLFDRNYTANMQQIDALTQENAALRAEKQEAERQAVESKAKEAIFEDKIKTIDAKTQAEIDKTNQALEQQAQEEAQTAQPIDNHTRCERTKQKMLDLGIPAAKEMSCDNVK